jgi:hypothetical protein
MLHVQTFWRYILPPSTGGMCGLSDAVEENVSVTQEVVQPVGREGRIVLSEWELRLPRLTFFQALPVADVDIGCGAISACS